MKKIFLFTFLVIVCYCNTIAQDGLNVVGGSVSVINGGSIRVKGGDVNVSDEGQIKNSFLISVGGDWINNNTTGQVFTNDSDGTVILNSTTPVTIGGTNTTLFYNLVLQVDEATLDVNTIVGGHISGANLGVLDLDNAQLNLNSHTLQITNSVVGALIENGGFVVSEDVLNESKVIWETSVDGGAYTIPFGTVSGDVIPMSIERLSGDLGTITVSTYPVGADMLPLPTLPEAVTSMLDSDGADLTNGTANRFWQLDKTGTGSANLSFTYADAETPVDGENNIAAYRYDTNSDRWQYQGATLYDAASNTLSVNNVTSFSPWTASGGASPVIDLNGITAGVDHDQQFRPTTGNLAPLSISPTLTSVDNTITSATLTFGGNIDTSEFLYVTNGPVQFAFTAASNTHDFTVNGIIIRMVQNFGTFTFTELSGTPIDNDVFIEFLNSLYYRNNTNTPTDGIRTANLSVTDTNSDTASATTTIRVYTNGPVAVDDTNSIAANNTGSVTGNVLTDGTPDSGTGLSVSEIDVYAPQVGVPYKTLYGTFTINSNGSYSYDVDESNSAVTGLKNGESIQDIVSYTVKDANDITDYGILSITINGVDEAPVALDNTDEINVITEINVSGNIITDIGVDGADFVDRGLSTLVWENEFSAPGGVFNGLSAPVNGQTRTISGVGLDFTSTDPSNIGVANQNQTVFQTGTNGGHTGYLLFAINAASNPSSDTQLIINFSEPVYNLGFLVADIDFAQSTSWQDQMNISGTLGGVSSAFNITTTGGVIDAGNGTYYGVGNAIASDATGNVNVFFEEAIDQLVLSYNYGPNATDADQGGQIAGISDIYWQGVDPNIVISEIDASAANVGVTYTGNYGTIVVNADGSYTYTPDTGNPAVSGLLVGETLTETFEYRLTDGANSDTANLIITLKGTQVDSDDDGIVDSVDLDDDNDGILDTAENAGGFDPNADDDSDGIENYKDSDFGIDANGDGVVDSFDNDSDGVSDHLDTDSDNDGCNDAVEAGHLDEDNDGEVDGSGYDTNGQVTGASTAYTGTTNGVTTASETTIDTAPTDQEERVGDDATFTVAASVLDASAYTSGTPTYDVNASPTYQWQVSTNSGSTFSNISGATNSSLTISDVTLIMDGNIYKVLVSSANNSCPEEAQATLTVINNVDAIDDSAGITAVEGFTGVNDVLNVLDNDEFNGVILTPASITITPVTNGPLTVNGDGSVDVANNTGTGSYTVNYQICDAANPSNCDIATVTVNVGVNSLPIAQDDAISVAQDSNNNSLNVLANNGNGPDDFGGDGPNAGAIALPSASSTNGGTVSINNNSTPLDPTDDTVLYTPAAGYSGPDSFTYTITDANNDSDTATVNVTVVPTPTIAINVVAGDDIINATEDDSPVTISGTSTNVEDGQTVTVILNGETYTTTVSSNTWTLNIPAVDAQALGATETITADVTNSLGTSAVQATRDIQHIATLPVPVLAIDDITADNVLNATEAGGNVNVTGTVSGDFNSGDTVTLTVNGTDYTGTVDGAGAYSIAIPGSELAADGDTTVDGSVTTTDTAGNVGTATDTQVYSVDTTPPVPVLAIDDITADNVLNATEAGGNVNVTGTVSGDFNSGDTVTLTVNGTDYTGTVDGAGAYSISISGSELAADGDTTVDGSVTTTDTAGNVGTATDTQVYAVDTTAPVPVLAIDDITADNVLNAAEAATNIDVTGTVSGDFNSGDTVTLTVNGTDYTGTVDGAGAYSIAIPGSELAADGDTTVDGSVSTTDTAGNVGTATDTQVYSVDTTAPVPVLAIDDITADNVLNATEAGGNVNVTGTVSGDFNSGDTVTLTVNGTDYTGTVDGAGAYSIAIPGSELAADGDTTVDGSVTTTDTAGNVGTATDTQVYSVDTTASVPVLAIDDITADNVLNATEAGGNVDVTGTVSGDFNSGDTVTLTVNGNDYTGTVDGAGAYSIAIPGSELAADGDTTVDGSVTTTDTAGNVGTATDTQVYSVDTTAPVPVLAIDDITADNVLNATEAGGNVNVTGTVSGDFNSGDTVTLTVNGTDYTGTVDGAGDYTIAIPGSELAADGDTTVDGSVTTTDTAGNVGTATDTQVYSVDTTAPVLVLAIDDITADNVLNATEAGGNVDVTGTVSGDFNLGDTVTLTVNGTDYTGTVDGAGAYSIAIPGSELAADGDTTVDGSVTTTDTNGNVGTATDTQVYSVDTTAPVPVLAIDDITADNVLNATEAGGNVDVTGTVSGDFNSGDTVTLTVNGTDYTGTVDGAGAYTIAIPGSELAADGDTTVDGSVTTTDTNGNVGTATDTQVYSVDTTAPVPVLAIDDITADNVLNATEAGGNVNVTGTVSGDFNSGDTVTLTLNGTDYTGTVDGVGAYSIAIPGSELAADGDTTVDGSVTTTDTAGNVGTATDTQVYSVDTTAPVPVLAIDDITADNVLNAAEAANNIDVTGTVSGDFNSGDMVTLTVNGTDYTGTVDGAGAYSIAIPGSELAADGDTTVDGSVTTTDTAGNVGTATDTQVYSVDTTAPVPVLAIDDITADNVLNATEAGGNVNVTGTVSGDFNSGDTVTLTVNGNDYTGTVDGAGAYSISISGSELAADGDTTVDGSVTTTDTAGNVGTATDSQVYSVDTTASVPVLAIDDITADNVLNATEAGGNVNVTGTVSGDFNSGDTVTLTVNGNDYTGTVDGAGAYSISISGSELAADGDTTVDGSVTTTDTAGNVGTATDTQVYAVDTTAPVPVLAIDDITADNVLNATEAGGNIDVTGTVSGDFNSGDTVTLTVNGNDYTGTVDGAGAYSISIPGSELAADGDTTVDGSVTTTDTNGNIGTATDMQVYAVDTTAPVPVLAIDDITADNVLNATEAGGNVNVTGTVSGDFNSGDTVTLTVNGTDYIGTVDGAGAYSIAIPGSELAADGDTTVDGSVTTTDTAGNVGTATDTQVYSVDTTSPAISIDVVAGDDIINDTEDDSPVTISGTTSNVEDGQIVTVTLNGQNYTASVTGNAWTLDISALDAQALGTNETITADVNDLGGNPAVQGTRDIQHDAVAPVPMLAIDDITADNILNAAEAGADVAVTGTVTGDFNTGDTVTLTVDGTDYTGTVDVLGDYSIDIPGSALAADVDTTVDGSFVTTDVAGNSATVTDNKTYTVDTVSPAPVLSIDDITADNILNATEAGADVAVTGTVTGDFNTGDTVTFTVDGTDYTGTVDALGDYSIDIPGSALAADGDTTVDGSFVTTDVAGNSATVTENKTYTVDTVSPAPVLSIDDITADNILNATEAGADVAVTGTVTGDFNTGDTVTLTVDGTDYTGTVDALGDYSIDIPGSALAADGDTTVDGSFVTTDGAGNSATVTDTKTYTVDLVNPAPVLVIDDVTVDNVLNAAEAGADVAVTGTVSGDFNAGDTVTLTVDGTDYTGTVDASGDFSINIPGSAMAADGDSTVDGSISTTDINGNIGTSTETKTYSVDVTAPVVTVIVDDITSDNSINAAEAGSDIPITGTVSGDFNENDPVTIVVNGNTYSGTVDALGNFSIDVPGSDLVADNDTSIEVSLTSLDTAGNSTSVNETKSYMVDVVDNDPDNDGLTNDEEDDLGTDPNNPDSDGDGINDGQEVLDATNPLDDCDSIDGTPLDSSDCDSDGLTNAEEEIRGTDPNIADTDEDTILDGQEVSDSTDPLNACSSKGGTPPETAVCGISVENDLVTPELNEGRFLIENIESYPQNTVKIFNRWGIKVFEIDGYDNEANVFMGRSTGRITIRANDELPVGVYFYIIEYVAGDNNQSLSGYLYINR